MPRPTIWRDARAAHTRTDRVHPPIRSAADSSPPRRRRAAVRLLACEHVADAAQGEGIAGDAEAGDDALADGGGLRGRTAPDRVRDVDLDGWKLDLRQRGDQRRIAAAEGGRIEDCRRYACVARLVDVVNDLALDVRVENLD